MPKHTPQKTQDGLAVCTAVDPFYIYVLPAALVVFFGTDRPTRMVPYLLLHDPSSVCTDLIAIHYSGYSHFLFIIALYIFD